MLREILSVIIGNTLFFWAVGAIRRFTEEYGDR